VTIVISGSPENLITLQPTSPGDMTQPGEIFLPGRLRADGRDAGDKHLDRHARARSRTAALSP